MCIPVAHLKVGQLPGFVITQHESMVGWVGVFMLSETVGVYVGLDANFGSRSHLTLFLSHPPSLNPTAGGGGRVQVWLEPSPFFFSYRGGVI